MGKLSNSPKCWVHCLDCKHREMIRRSMLERRTRIRCARCGGPVEASEASRKDMVRGMDRARELREQRQP